MNDPRPLRSSASWLVPLSLLVPLSFATGSTAHSPGPSPGSKGSDAAERGTRRDLAFARGVASRFRYVDVAERALSNVDERSLPDDLKEEYGLVLCDVYAAGARGEPAMEKRIALYDKAVDAYVSYIEDHPYSDFLPQAESAYISLVDDYAYSANLALEDLVGEPADDLRERMSSVLTDAIERVDSVLGALEPGNERWRTTIYKGRLLLNLAKISEEGIFFFSRCEQTLEDLALEAGEQTFWGMNAYLLMADAKQAQNEYRDSSEFASYVVNAAVPMDATVRDNIGWDDLPQEMKQRRFALIERGMPYVIDGLLNHAAGPKATEWALHFHNTWKRDGVALTPLGYLALLSCSRALLDTGGWVGGTVADADLAWFETQDAMRSAGFRSRRDTRRAIDLALSLAQTVNQENRGNTLQIRAQKLIADVIDRPGIVPDPEVLFEAAQGEYNARDYPAALSAFRRILGALETRDEATQKEYGASVLYHIGASLQRSQRMLEAAMAFRDGATTWRGDPEYDPKNARGFYDSISSFRRDAGGDPLIEGLWREAEQFRLDLEGGSQGDIIFRQAMRLYAQQNYDSARVKFKSVEPNENVYEEAVVRGGLCLYKQGDLAGASGDFASYLESYVNDPKNKLTTRAKQTARQKAKALATYYMGRIAYQEGDWAKVVRWLGLFHEEYPAQTDYSPVALYMAIEALLNQKELVLAKKTFEGLHEAFPDHKQTGVAALKIFVVLEQEQKAAEQAGDQERAHELLVEMADSINVSNLLDKTPLFSNLRKEARILMQLENWADAEIVLSQTIQEFGGDEDRATDIEKYVRPDLGKVLLAQNKIPEAFEVLDPVIPDPEDETDTRKPAAGVVRDWTRSIVGWIEGDARNIVEVPGVGGAETLTKAKTYLLKLVAREEKWTCPWFELKFELAYTYYLLGQLDSSNMQHAKETITSLQSLSGDDQLSSVATECGNDTLQRRYHWLLGKVQ